MSFYEPEANLPEKLPSVFNTERRIRIGVWGLGRGRAFYNSMRALNFDIVAGCDFNEAMRKNFCEANPGAWVTDDSEAFLKGDFEAVLIATFCPNHGIDALKAIEHGKHVLSEVTSFTTPAEGVALVEAVEKSGLVYNLAENYPFTAPNMYLERQWSKGLFGDLMYAEYEYVHEILRLAYSYNNEHTPIVPGHHAHHWRSWLNFHYYNTHSFGPIMQITGERATRVVALPTDKRLPGALATTNGQPAASLLTMSNGAVVRNLVGQISGDFANQRIWGTKASAEIRGGKLEIRLGGRGHSPLVPIDPTWKENAELARASGHGGGDFWVIYYFARQILEGTPAPFDIYRAADCTLPGILAYRSAVENGTPQEVPDFRDPAARDRYRNDHFRQEHLDPTRIFPEDADPAIAGSFCGLMVALLRQTEIYRTWKDWQTIRHDATDTSAVTPVVEKFRESLEEYRATLRATRELAERYPDSLAAGAIFELLAFGDEEYVLSEAIEADL